MDNNGIINAIVVGIKDYFGKNNVKKAVIGISGGLDSAVTAYLAVKALGRKNVIGMIMPGEVTSKKSVEDARNVVKNLGVKSREISISGFMASFKKINEEQNVKEDLYALANAKARTRMAILYYFANMESAFVIGTSDKSEIALGYTTKHGDNAADLLPIGDLLKLKVREVGKHMGIPQSILRKEPTAELIGGQTAEKELGAKYEEIDKILKLYMEEDLSGEQITKRGFDRKKVLNVLERLRKNEHKRRSPIIMRVSERSFHNREWRMPITNNYKEFRK